MRKRLVLLMTFTAVCEACTGLPIVPNIVVPNTTEIHEFHVSPDIAAKELYNTFLASVEEQREKAVCLVGEVVWVEKANFLDPSHQEERHLQLRLLDTYPANVDSATRVSVSYGDPICDVPSFGRAHTHIIPAEIAGHNTHFPSERDLLTLWASGGQYLTIILWGAGEYEGNKVVGTTWRMLHGLQWEWIIPVGGDDDNPR